MSTFKPEEIKALQEGGNGLFAARYLAKWTQGQLPRPTDRNTDRIHEWIQAVYEGKRFLDPDRQYVPSQRAATKSSECGLLFYENDMAVMQGKEVLVRQISDVLGSAPKLVVSRTDSLDKTPAKASPPATRVSATSAAPAFNLLDVASPKAAAGGSPGGQQQPKAPGGWDAFGTTSSPAGTEPAAAAPAAAGDGWAAFGESPAPAPPVAPPAANATSTQAAQGHTSNGNWEAFGEGAGLAGAGTSVSPNPVRPAVTVAAVSQPQQSQPQGAAQPPKREESRKEVPLDIFFPEFEQIRATGLLPNGQPAPMPVRSAQYGAYGTSAGQGYPQAQQQPYGAQPGYSSGFMQQPSVGAAFPGAPVARAAPPRPTVVIPGAHVYGGGVVPSPAASMHSPGSFGSSQGFSPQGGLSPAGFPQANGSLYHQHADPAGLRSSNSSEHGLVSASSAATPQSAVADPFSNLAPGFKSALPSYGSISSNGVARQQQQHLSQPQQHYGAGAGFSAAPAAYAVAPSPVGSAPAAAAGSPFGSSSLFGGPPSLAAMPYDLSAPAAPKPKVSGNPFA
ncbi:hypothetical protein N2152v2_008301 [Parachlorella kessleri]